MVNLSRLLRNNGTTTELDKFIQSRKIFGGAVLRKILICYPLINICIVTIELGRKKDCICLILNYFPNTQINRNCLKTMVQEFLSQTFPLLFPFQLMSHFILLLLFFPSLLHIHCYFLALILISKVSAPGVITMCISSQRSSVSLLVLQKNDLNLYLLKKEAPPSCFTLC